MSEISVSPEERRRRQEYERDERKRKWDADRALQAEIYAELHARRFDEAEAALLRRLDASGCRLFDAVRQMRITTPPASVGRWIGDLIAVAERAPRVGPITAVEISFSNAGVFAPDKSRPADPDIEVFGYTDEHFAFSTASDAELAEVCQGYLVPGRAASTGAPRARATCWRVSRR